MRQGNSSPDDMISVGRAIIDTLGSLRADIQALNIATLSGSFTPAVTITAASLVTLSFPADADLIEYDVQIAAATSTADLRIRATQAGVAVTGATDYGYGIIQGATFTNDDQEAFGVVATNNNTVVNQLYFRIYRPNSPNSRKYITWNGVMVAAGLAAPVPLNGGMRFNLNTAAIDGFQLFYSAGNINSIVYSARYNQFSS
jgi:hypothetical protein